MAGITQAERNSRDRLYELGLKQCNTCTEPKPLAEYSPRSDGYQGLYGSCRTCKNTARSDYQRRHPEKGAARSRRWRRENRDAWLMTSRRRDVRVKWRAANGVPA